MTRRRLFILVALIKRDRGLRSSYVDARLDLARRRADRARAPRPRGAPRVHRPRHRAFRSRPRAKGIQAYRSPRVPGLETDLAGGIAALSVSLAASPALAFGLGVTSPPPPELNSEGNSYIQGLLAKTEANKEIRKVEMESFQLPQTIQARDRGLCGASRE